MHIMLALVDASAGKSKNYVLRQRKTCTTIVGVALVSVIFPLEEKTARLGTCHW